MTLPAYYGGRDLVADGIAEHRRVPRTGSKLFPSPVLYFARLARLVDQGHGYLYWDSDHYSETVPPGRIQDPAGRDGVGPHYIEPVFCYAGEVSFYDLGYKTLDSVLVLCERAVSDAFDPELFVSEKKKFSSDSRTLCSQGQFFRRLFCHLSHIRALTILDVSAKFFLRGVSHRAMMVGTVLSLRILRPCSRLTFGSYPRTLCDFVRSPTNLRTSKLFDAPCMILDREPTRPTIKFASSETETPLPVTKWKSSPNMLPSPSRHAEASFSIPETVSSMNVKSRICSPPYRVMSSPRRALFMNLGITLSGRSLSLPYTFEKRIITWLTEGSRPDDFE